MSETVADRIVREALINNGRYLVRRRFGHEKSEEDLALDSLVASGHAQWLGRGMGPGIRLTGKPWTGANE